MGNLATHRGWFGFVLLLAALGALGIGVKGYLDTTDILHEMSQPKAWATTTVLAGLAAEKTSPLGQVYAALELDTLAARNDRAAAQLATRTWLRFLTSLFGGILALFGAAFVLGRVNSGAIDAAGGGGGVTASLKTTSPGIVLAVLGVFLMSLPLWALQEIQTRDAASFGVFYLTEGPDGPIVGITPGMPPAQSGTPKKSDEEILKELRNGST